MKQMHIEEMDEDKDLLDGIPPEELSLINKFLDSFILNTDSGTKVDQIDIKQALKALPNRIDESNLFKCWQYNFKQTKLSLTSFNNDDEDKLFEYYDNRNKSRLNKLNKKAEYTLG